MTTEPLFWLGVATAAGTVLVQVGGLAFIVGKFAERIKGLEREASDADAILTGHANKLEEHGNRISVLEVKVR